MNRRNAAVDACPDCTGGAVGSRIGLHDHGCPTLRASNELRRADRDWLAARPLAPFRRRAMTAVEAVEARMHGELPADLDEADLAGARVVVLRNGDRIVRGWRAS